MEVPLTLIVDAENDRVVVHPRLRLEQLIRLQELHLELALVAGYLLSHPLLQAYFLYVVLLVRCVHHHGDIIPVFLLGDTSVNPEVPFTESVNLERDLQEAVRCQILQGGE